MLTDADRERLRALQDRLLAVLRRTPYHQQRWQEPLWTGGPSAAQLEVLIWPAWEHAVRDLLAEVDG